MFKEISGIFFMKPQMNLVQNEAQSRGSQIIIGVKTV